MRSGQLARLTGVSTDTLRHYERLGILPPPQRTAGNYREYSPASQQRVELIRRASKISFSLSELKTILAVRDKGGVPCRRARELLNSKVALVGRQIANLTLSRLELVRLSKVWDQRLRRMRPGRPAGLLESIPQALVTADFGLPANMNKKG